MYFHIICFFIHSSFLIFFLFAPHISSLTPILPSFLAVFSSSSNLSFSLSSFLSVPSHPFSSNNPDYLTVLALSITRPTGINNIDQDCESPSNQHCVCVCLSVFVCLNLHMCKFCKCLFAHWFHLVHCLHALTCLNLMRINVNVEIWPYFLIYIETHTHPHTHINIHTVKCKWVFVVWSSCEWLM